MSTLIKPTPPLGKPLALPIAPAPETNILWHCLRVNAENFSLSVWAVRAGLLITPALPTLPILPRGNSIDYVVRDLVKGKKLSRVAQACARRRKGANYGNDC